MWAPKPKLWCPKSPIELKCNNPDDASGASAGAAGAVRRRRQVRQELAAEHPAAPARRCAQRGTGPVSVGLNPAGFFHLIPST